MTTEERLSALEHRLQVAEDHLEILRLLNSYGPLADSGSSGPVSQLWVKGGFYDISLPEGGSARLKAPEDLIDLYEGEGHMAMVREGLAHFTGTPRITVKGDGAQAVGYSLVISKKGDGWIVWRAAINEWTLTRTAEGWRIVERFNRVLNGSPVSHETMRKVLVS